MTKEEIKKYNNIILNRLSIYLNNNSKIINKEMVENLTKELNISKEEAFKFLLAEILGLNATEYKEVFNIYFKNMIKMLNKSKYENNDYYKNIKIDNINYKKYSFKNNYYEPYEAFVYNDLIELDNGVLLPSIGFFDEKYNYPSILENGREWMLITPNEIETMDKVINESEGHVLTYGLGLGYFAYMSSLKEEVIDVTIIEKDNNIIELFNKYILPQFKYKNKIKIIKEDAFTFAKEYPFNYDFVFADIWHDPSDGIELYLKFKKLEKENIIYRYWIEDTIKCYL